VSFRFNFHKGAVTVTGELLEDVPGFIGELPLAGQIFQTLQEYGPQSARDIASITNLNLASIQVILSRDTRFKRAGGSKWEAV